MNERKIKLEKKINELKHEIKERKKDAYYSDSWEQSAQIREDIECKEKELAKLEKELETL